MAQQRLAVNVLTNRYTRAARRAAAAASRRVPVDSLQRWPVPSPEPRWQHSRTHQRVVASAVVTQRPVEVGSPQRRVEAFARLE